MGWIAKMNKGNQDISTSQLAQLEKDARSRMYEEWWHTELAHGID